MSPSHASSTVPNPLQRFGAGLRAIVAGAGELAKEIVADFAPQKVLSSESTKLIQAIFDDSSLKEAGRVVDSDGKQSSHCIVSFGVDSATPCLGRLSLRRWQLSSTDSEFFTVDVQPPDADQRIKLCVLWPQENGHLTYAAKEAQRTKLIEAVIDEIYVAFKEKRIEANAARDLPGLYEGWKREVRPRA
jgi:hypothetical protein